MTIFKTRLLILRIKLLNLRMFSLRDWLKEKLGIPSRDEMKQIHKRLEASEVENRRLKSELSEIELTNTTILRHLKFLNNEFVVTADIEPHQHGPSVVLIIQKHGQKIVKTYTFRGDTLEEIYKILEGFGQRGVEIDRPRGFPSPRFRY